MAGSPDLRVCDATPDLPLSMADLRLAICDWRKREDHMGAEAEMMVEMVDGADLKLARAKQHHVDLQPCLRPLTRCPALILGRCSWDPCVLGFLFLGS